MGLVPLKAFGAVMRQLAPAQLVEYLPLLDAAMREFKIDSELRAAAFLAQMAHESAGLTRWTENLNYSATGLMNTWPRRFPTPAAAQHYHRQPEKIANKVYANRMGNGSEASGDGWRYRGRGPGQLTGRENYTKMAQRLGVDLVANPDLVATPAVGFRSFGAFWMDHGLNPLADLGQMRKITLAINGGLLGLDERQELYEVAKRALGLT